MDYYEGVVVEYLRQNRRRFVNPDCLIQLDDVPQKGRHWYCDVVAVELAEDGGRVFLCEVSYSKGLSDLRRRLNAWRAHWSAIKATLVRDCGFRPGWAVVPWVFAPEDRRSLVLGKSSLASSGSNEQMPTPLFTALEKIVPWGPEHSKGGTPAP